MSRFLIESQRPVLDVFPDRGMARLRLFGQLTDDALRAVSEQWSLSG